MINLENADPDRTPGKKVNADLSIFQTYLGREELRSDVLYVQFL